MLEVERAGTAVKPAVVLGALAPRTPTHSRIMSPAYEPVPFHDGLLIVYEERAALEPVLAVVTPRSSGGVKLSGASVKLPVQLTDCAARAGAGGLGLGIYGLNRSNQVGPGLTCGISKLATENETVWIATVSAVVHDQAIPP